MGIHDLGGMAGFGAVEAEPDEPVFHQRWEARAFALNALGIAVIGAYNADEYRHAIERMDPAHYLAASYYERVLTGVATLLVEKGVVTQAELEELAGGRFPLAQPIAAAAASEAPRPAATERFRVGDAVVVRSIHPSGHTRVPRYVRGKRGSVLRVAPPFSFPDAAAHGLPPREEPTYCVRFDAAELWGEAAEPRASVVVDLWHSYLERA